MISSHDCPCSKSEVDLFSKRPVQTVLEKAGYLDVHPLNNVATNTGPIEFHVAGSPEDYIDLNDTALYLRVKITESDGQPAVADDKVFPVNNFMHSIFSNASLIIGDKQIEGGIHMYPYRAYLSNLLLFNSSIKDDGALRASGFLKDEPGKLDDEENDALATRMGFFTQTGNTADFYGPLWLDMFTQSRYLLNQIDMRLRLDRSKPEFCFIRTGDANTKTVKVDIENAILYVRRVKVDAATLQMNENQLKVQNAVYPVQRTEMLSYTISKGDLSHCKENLFRGQLPKFVIVGMVLNKAYNGDWENNPFNFQHFNVNHVALYRDGESIPGRPYTPDFSKNLYAREYMSLLSSLELYNRNEDNDIEWSDYDAGYTLFGFNLTPDMTMAGHAQPYREGNLRLELKFAKALPDAINVIVMAVFDGVVEITRHRNVLTDFRT